MIFIILPMPDTDRRRAVMARPKKTGLDYFPFDVDFFSDKKIKRLRAKYGNDGIVIYIYMLCIIYGDKGYYTEFDDDLILDISDELNVSESSTRQIMKYLLSRSLLSEIRDSTLAKPVTIISAKSIQRRFQEAKKGGKRNVLVKAGYWLLEKAETLGFIKVLSSENFSGKNESYSGKNEGYSGKNDTKESKVNKSKVKESKVCTSGFSIPCKNGTYVLPKEDYENLTHTYPDMDVDKSLDKLRKYLTANPHKQGYVSAAKAYVDMWLCEDDQTGKYRKECSVIKPAYDLHEYEDSGMLGPEWDDIG